VSAAYRLLHPPSEAVAQEPARALRVWASQPKVVHVHGNAATSWDYASGWFGDFVDQATVDQMVDRGLMALTGAATRVAAWRALLPAYVPGQRIAMKVNLNNAGSLNDSDNLIDALIEPVNSVVQGLKEMGVAESDIWVYDATKTIPNRFRNGCAFPGVQFSGRNVNPQGWSATEKVAFRPPPSGPALADQRISQVLANAHYLINVPIMKRHRGALVTLSFKNHFGSIENCRELHDRTFPASSIYNPTYNPLVEIYRNPHFAGKTVLTIGDGLYGSRGHQSTEPEPWVTFGGGAPNSLFFSRDPVALDCVMYDYLAAEAGVEAAGDDHLVLADAEGLGVCEHRDPGATSREQWYSLIHYVFVELDGKPMHRRYVPFVLR
jgi:hypothetical protein